MKERSVDVAILGTGTAGMNAYRAARKHTDQVVVIENHVYGTTCARVGCMPSKLLIAAAEAAHRMEVAPQFGVHPGGKIKVDGKAVMKRVREERDRFVGFVLEAVDSFPETDRIKGHARFTSENTLEIDDHTRVRARAFVIATGSRPSLPVVSPDTCKHLVTSDDVFYWDDLPASLGVIGTGVIGLELGQAFHRLGVRTKNFGRSGRIGPFQDSEMLQVSEQVMNTELPLFPQARNIVITSGGEGAVMTYEDPQGNACEETFEYILCAAGRDPNVDLIGLETTGLALDSRGVPLYNSATMQCGESHIFIAGDANDELPILHEASDEGRIAGENAAKFPDVNPGHRRSPMVVVFTEPQMMTIGTPFSELEEGTFVTGSVDFTGQGRSRVMLRNKGKLHVYADSATGRLLGAEMLGPDAEHIAHLLAWSHQQRLAVEEILELPFYHPVVEEGLRTALRDAAARRKSS
jgi:dihydrolipoamide dehydrogenase